MKNSATHSIFRKIPPTVSPSVPQVELNMVNNVNNKLQETTLYFNWTPYCYGLVEEISTRKRSYKIISNPLMQRTMLFLYLIQILAEKSSSVFIIEFMRARFISFLVLWNSQSCNNFDFPPQRTWATKSITVHSTITDHIQLNHYLLYKLNLFVCVYVF